MTIQITRYKFIAIELRIEWQFNRGYWAFGPVSFTWL